MLKHQEYLWKDPFGPSPGPVLLSDQIHFLADEAALISPFDPNSLRPASYDVRVGSSYYVNDVRMELTGESNKIEIPPNGLVYVKTKETFSIPYYLVARYSLRVHQVYRGLLIDNGLHIDPGFCGCIWIPVHNFTTQPRILLQNDEFISIEFNRTTGLPADVNKIATEEELVSRGVGNLLKGSHGRNIKVFYKDLKQFEKRHQELSPHYFWDKFASEKHQSATLGTEQRLDKVEQDVSAKVQAFSRTLEDRLNSLRTIGFVALAGLVIGLLAILLPILYGEYGKSREIEAEHGAEIRTLRDRLQEQKSRIDAMSVQSAPSQGSTRSTQQKGKQ